MTGETITRFFAAHVMIVPLTFGAVLAIHLILIQMQGMSLPVGMAETEVKDHRPFFSEFALIDACLWLLLFGAIVTLSVFLPAEVGVKADLLKPAPEGIKPEWYFLFMFQTLKHVNETLGVALFALAAVVLLVLPFLDRNANRERRSPGFTAVLVLVLVYAVAFEVWALSIPGPNHAVADVAEAEGSMAGDLVSLGLFWAVIVFLVFYLLQLLRHNRRIRHLYREPPC